MSEELLQRNSKKKIGSWDFYSIGSTTVNQLKKMEETKVDIDIQQYEGES